MYPPREFDEVTLFDISEFEGAERHFTSVLAWADFRFCARDDHDLNTPTGQRDVQSIVVRRLGSQREDRTTRELKSRQQLGFADLRGTQDRFFPLRAAAMKPHELLPFGIDDPVFFNAQGPILVSLLRVVARIGIR